MIRITCLILFSLPVWVLAQYADASKLEKHVKILAADKMGGRSTGSPEQEKVIRYIQKQFKKNKLAPAGTVGYRQSFTFKKRGEAVESTSENVIGFLDNGASYTLVMGAHYDHVGRGGSDGTSMAKDGEGKIHNGADDNASGVAGMLELARYYAKNDIQEPFNVLFIAFGAEEHGLHGARHFVQDPTVPLEQIKLMVNYDMIGRYRDTEGLQVYTGRDTTGWEQALTTAVPDGLQYSLKPDNGRYGSDHKPFEQKQIPVLWFFTGLHDDYHRPTDDTHKINFAVMEDVVDITISVLEDRFSQ